jgi:2-dehydropantoate 2-reductase
MPSVSPAGVAILRSSPGPETAAVARAHGVAPAADVVERTMAFVDAMPAPTTASMQRDIIAGRPSELEAQSGALVRLGRAAGVPTPTHAFLYAALLPQERRARRDGGPASPRRYGAAGA